VHIIALRSPIVRRKLPRHYGLQESVVSLTAGLVARGHDVTLLTTGDSLCFSSPGDLTH